MDMADAGVAAVPGLTTGAFLVLLDPEALDAGADALRHAVGLGRLTAVRPSELTADELATADAVLFADLGVAVVSVDPDQEPALFGAVGTAEPVLAVEPERVVWALGGGAVSADYLRGARDVLDLLVQRAEATIRPAIEWDETQLTWGLQAVRAEASGFTGAGVRVAVLDTGVDTDHRDLLGRELVTRSFVAGQEVQDGNGHGTHCIGTACGREQPAILPRYGLAGGAQIHAGKVLSNAGSGADRGILAGISWAVEQQCRVVSMSLGAPVEPGTAFSEVFEAAAARARELGTLIVAAAGNDSTRPSRVAPVSHPANCPSILAVAALTPDLEVAPFSNAGLNPQGGQIDVAAPGVDVRSAWPEPTGYRTISGTSMATPHVAGVLALLGEEYPQASAAELTTQLLQRARRLPLPATDVGAGLVQAV